MNMPLELCEARDTKGLYKLARSGKIKGVLCETCCLSCCFNTLTWLSAFKTQSPPPPPPKKKKNPKQKRKEYTLCYVIKLKIMTWRFIPIIAMIKGKKLNCYSECGFQLAISKVL